MNDIIVDILKIVAPLSVACIVFAQGLAIGPSLVLVVSPDAGPGQQLRLLVSFLHPKSKI